MPLSDALLAHKPRETSGAAAANRFAYQRTWALCHALELHEGAEDYVVVLEFHDDVLVLDQLANPSRADFFQVKTKRSGTWSLARLLQTKAGKTDADQAQSVLGRLVDHVKTLRPHIRTLNLVSNACFKIDLAGSPQSEDRERFAVSDVHPDIRSSLSTRIKTELSLAEEPDWTTVHLIVTPISLADHETHGAGRLSALLEKRTPGGKFAVRPLFTSLIDEFKRRANDEWQPASYEDLCKRKAIARDEIEHILKVAESSGSPSATLADVEHQLQAEGNDYRTIQRISRGWQRYEVERIDRANLTVQGFRNQLREVLRSADAEPWSTMTDLVSLVADRFRALPSTEAIDQFYLYGAILFEHKAYEAWKPPATSQESENPSL